MYDVTASELLYEACAAGDLDEVQRLLAHVPPPDLAWASPTGMTALHVAAEMNYPDVIRLLTAGGAALGARDERGWTALHWAVDSEIDGFIQNGPPLNLSTTECLMELGADPNAAAPDGTTPVSIATRYRCKPALEILVRGRPTTA